LQSKNCIALKYYEEQSQINSLTTSKELDTLSLGTSQEVSIGNVPSKSIGKKPITKTDDFLWGK
jgi:hypothetical protein